MTPIHAILSRVGRLDGPRRLRCATAALICLLALTLHAPVRAAETMPTEFMPASELRPGMIGEGRTVFSGYKIETFKAEILGVKHENFAGGDVIYAKLSAPLLEQHGVVAGMSGSPVYVNGRLIGAVAYGWSFAYKPYCGITPIEQMWNGVYRNIGRLKAPRERRAGARVSLGGEAAAASEPPAVGQAWNWEADWKLYRATLLGGPNATEAERGPLAGSWRPEAHELADEPGQMQPLASPLFLSGGSPGAARLLTNFFAARGMSVIAAGLGGVGSSGAEGNAPELEGGSALGVPLLSGDLALASIGTVTWRKGDKLIAFGHPMFFKGPINAPMAPARVFGVMQSYSTSFKLGEVGAPIGTLDQDRVYGVGGSLGASPDRVPVTVRVGGGAAAIAREYHFSAWKDPDVTPALILSATQEAFEDSVAQDSKLTADVSYIITLADGRRIEKTTRASSDGAAVAAPLGRLLRDLFLMANNPFAEGDVASVNVSIRVEPGLRDDDLIDLSVDHDRFEPGQTARVTATIRPWRGDDYQREACVTLPKELTPGAYLIQVSDVVGAERLDRLARPGFYSPRDFDQVVALATWQPPRADALTVSLVQPASDLDLKGRLMTKLPGSVGELMRSSAPERDLATASGRVLSQQTIPAQAPISGGRSIKIEVVRRVDQELGGR